MNTAPLDLVTQAIALARAERGADALATCERALVVDPSCEPALAWRAVALAQLGRHEDARTAARVCLRQHLGNAVALDLLHRLGVDAEPARSATGSDWETGRIVRNRWEIFGSAGGAMGRVYFVRDGEWGGMELAIKSLAPAHAEDELARRLFRRETQVWLDLGGHPHIVSGYYTLEIEGQLRFFMEYVAGSSLADVLRAAGRGLPVARALDLAIQLAAGMSYAHAKGVVHRDLKPANCMVAAADTVKVTDFGLSSSLSRLDPLTSTSAFNDAESMLDQGPGGTPLYMAPEQWRALSEATSSADVYAFGVLVYELLANEPPFVPSRPWLDRFGPRLPHPMRDVLAEGRLDPMRLLRELHDHAPPVPLRERGVSVPSPLDTLLQRCMLKKADARPSFARVCRDLIDIHELATGEPYRRELGAAMEPTEAGENNRAISYHVMGKLGRARQIVDEWMREHPTAIYPWMNRATMQIRAGEVEPAHVAAELYESIAATHPTAIDSDPAVSAFARRLAPSYMRAGSSITALAVGRDGRIAAGQANGNVTVWRAETGVREHVLEGHGQRVSAVAFDIDGALVSASWDRTIRAWDVGGSAGAVLRGSADWVSAVAVRGDYVVGGAIDGSLRVWHRSRGRLVHTMNGHHDWVEDLAVIDDHVVSASRDGTVKIWQIDRAGALALRESIDVGPQPVAIVSEFEGGILIGRHDGALVAWRGGILWRIDAGAEIVGIASDPHRQLVFTATVAGTLQIIDAATGSQVRSIIVGPPGVTAAVIAVGAGRAWLGRNDGSVWRTQLGPGMVEPASWPLATRRPRAAGAQARLERERDRLIARLDSGDADAHDELEALRSTADELARSPAVLQALHLAGERSGVRRGLRDAWTAWQLEVDEAVTALAVAADGVMAWVGTRGGHVVAIEIVTGHVVGRLAVRGTHGRTAPILHVAAAPDGGAVIASADGTVARIAPRAAGVIWRTIGHARPPLALFWPRGASHAVSAGDDGLCVWNPEHGEVVHRVALAGITAVDATRDGDLVVGALGRLTTWRLDGVARVDEVDLAGCRPLAIASVPCGFLVRTTGTTCVVLSRSGRVIRTMPGETFALARVAVTADGRLAAFASRDFNDNRFHLWNPATGALMRSLDHGAPVREVAFAGGGSALITGDERGAVRRWTLDTEWCRAAALAAEAEALVDGGPSSLWPSPEDSPARAECRSAAADELARAIAGPQDPAHARIAVVLVKLRDQHRPAPDTQPGVDAVTSAILTEAVAVAERIGPVAVPERVLAIAIAPDGAEAVFGGRDGRVMAVHLASGRSHAISEDEFLCSVTVTEDRIVRATDSTVIVCNRSGGPPLARLRVAGATITALVTAPRNRIAIATTETALQIWSMAGPKPHRLDGHTDGVSSLAIATTAGVLISGGLDHTARLWRLDNETMARVLTGHSGPVTAVAAAPNGDMFATGSDDEHVRLWDDRGAPFADFDLGGPVRSVALVGGLVVAGARTGGVVGWRIADRERLLVLDGRSGQGLALAANHHLLTLAGSPTMWKIACQPR